MNPGHVFLTFAKELREALRDRRTLAIMILLPLVVYPLLAMLAAQVATGREKQREERPSTIAIAGASPTREALTAQVLKDPAIFVLWPTGTPADVEHGRLDALVELDPRDDSKLTVIYDASRDESRTAEDRFDGILAKAFPEGCAPRFTAQRRSVAPQARLGGYLLSKALPLFVVLMVLLGAFYPAIDVTAGERERGTLETVLCSPIRRFDLMLGKVLAVAALAALTGVLNLASMAITLMQILRLAAQNIVLDIPWGHALLSSLVIFPAALLFAAAFVALGATARSFKEAQTLLLPVYFLTVAPAMAGAIGEYQLAGIVAWIPGMNITLLARDLLVGRATWSGGLATIASTLLLSVAALAAAARIYDSERLVAPPPPATPRRHHANHQRRGCPGSFRARLPAALLRVPPHRAAPPSRRPSGRGVGGPFRAGVAFRARVRPDVHQRGWILTPTTPGLAGRGPGRMQRLGRGRDRERMDPARAQADARRPAQVAHSLGRQPRLRRHLAAGGHEPSHLRGMLVSRANPAWRAHAYGRRGRRAHHRGPVRALPHGSLPAHSHNHPWRLARLHRPRKRLDRAVHGGPFL